MLTRKKLSFVTDIKDIRGKRVIVRSSLNVPVKDGCVVNYFRIMRAMPTFMHLSHAGAKIIIVTHLGRDSDITLEPIYDALKNHLKLKYIKSVIGDDVEEAVKGLKDGETLLLENVRSNDGEISNDDAFAKKLASYGDIYVNDAFPVSHRKHATIVGIPKYIPSYAGLTFQEEYIHLKAAMEPRHPALFILGGAKFETKQPLVERYVEKYDRVFVGGALANDFFVARGYEIGTSLFSKCCSVSDKLLNNDNILLPIDVTVSKGSSMRVTTPDIIKNDEKILDAGPATMAMLENYINKAETILWNGPLGDYENGFIEHTQTCANLIAKSSARTIIGGGDTVAAIESLAINDKFGFLSTAGGAMLAFLEKGTLPGIEAMLKSHKK